MLTGTDRKSAADFLGQFQQHLAREISPDRVKAWILQRGNSANEGHFLDELVLPKIPEFLRRTVDASATDKDVQTAFLAESTLARKRGWASDSPRSSNRYLFTKEFGTHPQDVVKSWWENPKGGVSQSCPDWAFRAPSPHAVVFEAKLFRHGRIDAARSALVSGIYQCFYYRAHPEVPPTETHPAWKYDYACLFAYDASESQKLVEAWKTLNKEVKDACWCSANIFVVVLPVGS